MKQMKLNTHKYTHTHTHRKN